jgi:recombination protein RecR
MSAVLDALIEALRCLPGVGPKTAQRMAYHLLQHERESAFALSEALAQALTHLRHCQQCNAFSQEPLCRRCQDPARDSRCLCVVESPADLAAIEATQTFSGLYYVLMGRASPLEGIGARELGLERLVRRVQNGEVQEVIIATNFTSEGEATAHMIEMQLKHTGVALFRPSRGLPVGAELEHADSGTVAQAILERRKLSFL